MTKSQKQISKAVRETAKQEGIPVPPFAWTRAAVGEHWTHPAYPQAVVSSFVKHGAGWTNPRSGYVAVVNFAHIGEFASRELAQQAVEAYLG